MLCPTPQLQKALERLARFARARRENLILSHLGYSFQWAVHAWSKGESNKIINVLPN